MTGEQPTVGIVDYGVGNIGSLTNMFRHLGAEVVLCRDEEGIATAKRLVLPGVGAFDHAMTELRSRGLVDALTGYAETGAPLLGICLGMQLLLESSEEGVTHGLGLIQGGSVRFDGAGTGVRVPQMGWNTVTPLRSSPLFEGLETENRFYFVHSYAVECADPADELGRTEYGRAYTSMVQHGNVVGMQFHPEKSHTFGMRLLSNWMAS